MTLLAVASLLSCGLVTAEVNPFGDISAQAYLSDTYAALSLGQIGEADCGSHGAQLLNDVNCKSYVINSDLTVCGDVTVRGRLTLGTGFSAEDIYEKDDEMSRKYCVLSMDHPIASLEADVPVIVVGRVEVHGKVAAQNITLLPGSELHVASEGSMNCLFPDLVDVPSSIEVPGTIEVMSGATVTARHRIKTSKAVLDNGAVMVTECGELEVFLDGNESAGIIVSDGSIVMANGGVSEQAAHIFSQLILANGAQAYLRGYSEVLSMTQLDNGSFLWVGSSIISPLTVIDDASVMHAEEDISAPVLLNAIDGSDVTAGGTIDGGMIQIYDGSNVHAKIDLVSVKNIVVESSQVEVGHDVVAGGSIHVHKGSRLSVAEGLRSGVTIQASSSTIDIGADAIVTGHIVLSKSASLDVGGDLACSGMTQKDVDEMIAAEAAYKDNNEDSAGDGTPVRRLQGFAPDTSGYFMSALKEETTEEPKEPEEELKEEEPPAPYPGFFCSHSTTRVGGDLNVLNSWFELKQCNLSLPEGTLAVEVTTGLVNIYQGSRIEVMNGNLVAGTALLVTKNSHIESNGDVSAALVQVSNSSSLTTETLDVGLDLQVSNNSQCAVNRPLELGPITSVMVGNRSLLDIPSLTRRPMTKKEKKENKDDAGGALYLTGRSSLQADNKGVNLSEGPPSAVVVQDNSTLLSEGPLILAGAKSKKEWRDEAAIKEVAEMTSVLRVENHGKVLVLAEKNPVLRCALTKESTIQWGGTGQCDATSITLNQAVPGLLKERLNPKRYQAQKMDSWNRYVKQEEKSE